MSIIKISWLWLLSINLKLFYSNAFGVWGWFSGCYDPLPYTESYRFRRKWKQEILQSITMYLLYIHQAMICVDSGSLDIRSGNNTLKALKRYNCWWKWKTFGFHLRLSNSFWLITLAEWASSTSRVRQA